MNRSYPAKPQDHFAFGENWKSFVQTVTDEHVVEARRSLSRLVPEPAIAGRRFLDIGCGSGLSMLAAAQLGAAELTGVDIDASSVDATRQLLGQRLSPANWRVRQASVFDLTPESDGTFDIVHSWGVLHHTGDMWRAIGNAAALVAPGGRLVLALYRSTPLCRLWRAEKRLYSRSGEPAQGAIRWIYRAAFHAGLYATGRSPSAYIENYKSARGMDWEHDIHDWLGGFPYESVGPDELLRFLGTLGFDAEQVFEKPAAIGGLLGSHCDEYVMVRRA